MDELQKLMGTKWGHGCLKTYVKAEGVSYIVLENGDLLGVHRPNTLEVSALWIFQEKLQMRSFLTYKKLM